MSRAAATSLPLPAPRTRSTRAARSPRWHAAAPAVRDSVVVRLAAFAALAAFAGIHWATMLDDPPVGRVAIAIVVAVAGAATIAAIAARLPRLAAWPLALAAATTTVAAGAIAIGLPARLVLPGNWGELADGLNRGLSELGTAEPPYSGGGWLELAVLLGLPLCLGLAAALAFWPARRRAGTLRTAALVILVAAYATGITATPSGAALLNGLVLLLLIAAWVWLPRLGRRDALAGAALVLAAGALAMPLAAVLDGKRPWLDYRDWTWAWFGVGGGMSFDWDHSYGPMDWSRTGRALLDVKSDAPHYWRTTVLDHFDGFRWLQSEERPSANVELPPSGASRQYSPQTARLRPGWIDEIEFSVRGLSSELVVGAGAVLSVDGLDGVTAIPGGIALADGGALTEGDSYTVRAYVPEPSARQMLSAASGYPQALAPFAEIEVPRTQTIDETGLGRPPGSAESTVLIASEQVAVPLRGSGQPEDRAAANRALSASPYGGVYRLARRLTADAPTTYDAVKAIHDHLQDNYAYSEIPPERSYPLRAFLFRDRVGYCQQFSGAMTLMLRMVGIPSRVATGFSPGTTDRGGDGVYRVLDLDAHSWVEVYFNGIGWVPFDPTPSDAPAQSQTNGLGLFADALRSREPPLGKRGHVVDVRPDRPAAVGGSRDGFSPWLVPLFALVLALAAGAARVGVRALRSRALAPAAAIEARLRELEEAIRRLHGRRAGGTTLLALEHRLERVAGPAAAAYAARLRAARYAPLDPGPPTPAERRALRRDLSARRGLRVRLRGFLAIPPGGPTAS